jgi:hypothetical protein
MEDWESTNDNSDPNVSNMTYYNALYANAKFQNLWGTLHYLNQKGFNSTIALSFMGRVPTWMGGATINSASEDEAVEMITTLVNYARNTEGVQFGILDPFNEPDWDGLEGPQVSAAQYTRLLHKISVKLDAMGLSDIRFIGPNTANVGSATSSYGPAMMGDSAVISKLDHWGLHNYGGDAGGMDNFVKSSAFPNKNFWMSEYTNATDAFSFLGQGPAGLMIWEGFDSVFNHAILAGRGSAPGNDDTAGPAPIAYNSSTKTYTPRLGFYQNAQIFKFVSPGSKRIGTSTSLSGVTVYAFYNSSNGQITIVGNNTGTAKTISGNLTNLPAIGTLQLYQTNSSLNLQRGADATVSNGTFSASISANTIFTLTTGSLIGNPPPPPPPPPPAPTVSISANPTTINAGLSSTLSWSSTNATSCTASGSWSGAQTTSGSTSVTPSSTSAYTLTCTGTGGSANQSATITVNAITPPPPPPPPGTFSWSGIIAPNRATDWSTAGVVGGIPSSSWPDCTTAACNTLFGGSVTATTIQNALASAPANSVVRIPAGTYTVGAWNFSQNNVVLRGAGGTATKLVSNGTTSGCGLGLPRAVNMCPGATGNGRFGGVTSANWTGGYGQGSTALTLSSTTGITAGPVGTGTLLYLDQLNDVSDGYPGPGDLYVCENTINNCSNQGGNNYARSGRAQTQVVTVTAINGLQVTITPGLVHPNWRSLQNPGAYWNPGSPQHNAGIENLTVDYDALNGSGLFIKDCANCWVTGTRWITTSTGSNETYGLFLIQSAHVTIRSNYIYGRITALSPFPVSNYNFTDQETSDDVVENNIFHHNPTAMLPNDPQSRNVYAYNYFDDGYIGIAGPQLHSGTIFMDLFEGNNTESFFGDIIHGPHYMVTLFRNHFDGGAHNNSQTYQGGIALNTNNRFFNLIGNVLGSSGWTAYQSTTSGNGNIVYSLGWQGNASGTTLNIDPNVSRTLLRWGNWDSVTSTNDNGVNDATGTRFVNSEVPSNIPNFANLIPATTFLPPSFYLTFQPSWWTTAWGTPAWPAVGPDVSNPTPLASTGGHAYKIPARLCFENSASDPAYGSSNPRIKIFDAATCYTASGNPPPPPPPPNTLPVGNFDGMAPDGITLRGWSYDPDLSSSSNTVQIFINGPLGTGTLISTQTTSILRTDVNSSFSITGNHGFEFAIPTQYRDGLAHAYYIYGIDINDSTKSFLLTGSPKTFTVASAATPVAGDINLDHIVNSIDFSILNSRWFTADATSDLNHDGIVNAIDFSILNSNWFKTW